jgi:phage gp46-like protein
MFRLVGGGGVLALAYSNENQRGDLVRDGGNLETDEGLETAVTISLFTDARAVESDGVDADADKRGWWGDRYLEPTHRIGSKLWLLHRAKTTPANLTRAATWARESLQWLIDDRIASSVDVAVSRLTLEVYLLTVKIQRPSRVAPRWEHTWEVQLAL